MHPVVSFSYTTNFLYKKFPLPETARHQSHGPPPKRNGIPVSDWSEKQESEGQHNQDRVYMWVTFIPFVGQLARSVSPEYYDCNDNTNFYCHSRVVGPFTSYGHSPKGTAPPRQLPEFEIIWHPAGIQWVLFTELHHFLLQVLYFPMIAHTDVLAYSGFVPECLTPIP